uniref:Zinc finger PHD-type domain-containing protein n=1 Tax=Schizophyllum commune (strain H4-8 / FGSC 9210) TaxID=578458 RepID=D8QHQ9_SCHCM
MSRRSSLAGVPAHYTFVPQPPVPGPSTHHPTADLTMLRTHAPNQPTASAHQPAPTYRSASLSMAGVPTHGAASPTFATPAGYPYSPVPASTTPGPSPDVYWKQLDDYVVRRLNEVLKWQADAMSAQDARLAKCEEALKACIADARTEATQQNERISQQNEHMAQQNERANIILKALCDHAKGLDDKVDRLSKAIGVEVKEGEPETSLSSRVKDVEWTMGELLERIGDPLALDPNAPQQPFVNTHRRPPVIRHEVAVETSPTPTTPPPAPRTPTPPPPFVVRHEMATSPIRFMDVDDEPNDVEDERIGVEDERIDVEDEQENSEQSNDTAHPLTPISAPVARHRGGVRTNTLGLAARTKPLAPHSSMPSPTPSVRGRTVSAEEPVPACTTMASERAQSAGLPPPTHDSDLRLPTPDATVRYSSVPGDMAVDEVEGDEVAVENGMDEVEDMPEMWTDDPIEDYEEGRVGDEDAHGRDGEGAHGQTESHDSNSKKASAPLPKKPSAALPKKASVALPRKTPSASRRPLTVQPSEDSVAVNAYLLGRSSPAMEEMEVEESGGDAAGASSFANNDSHPSVQAAERTDIVGGAGIGGDDAGDASDSDLSSLSSLSDVEDAGAAGRASGARPVAGPVPTASEAPRSTRYAAQFSAAGRPSFQPKSSSLQPKSSSLQPKSKGKEKSAAATRIKRRRADDGEGAPAKRARVGEDEEGAGEGASMTLKGKIQQIKEEEGEQMLSSSSSRASSVRRGRSGSARGGSAREDSARRGRSGSLRSAAVKQEKSANGKRGESISVKQEKGEKKRGRSRKKPQWPKLVEGSGSTFWTTECDCCGQWYHNGCVGLDKEADSDVPFCCPFCVVDPHYKDTVKKVHEGMCMRPDCPHEIDVENYLGEYEIDYLVGRFVKISSQQPKQEWYLVKWAKP